MIEAGGRALRAPSKEIVAAVEEQLGPEMARLIRDSVERFMIEGVPSGCVMIKRGGQHRSCLFCNESELFAKGYVCPGYQGLTGLAGLVAMVRGGFEACGGRNIQCGTCTNKRPECYAFETILVLLGPR